MRDRTTFKQLLNSGEKKVLCCCLTKRLTPKIQMFCGVTLNRFSFFVVVLFSFFVPFVCLDFVLKRQLLRSLFLSLFLSFFLSHFFLSFSFPSNLRRLVPLKRQPNDEHDQTPRRLGREGDSSESCSVCHHQTVYTNWGGWRGEGGSPCGQCRHMVDRPSPALQ